MFLTIFASKVNKAEQSGYDFGSFLAENIYLIIGLIVGIIVAVVMRNTFKMKP